MADDDEPHELPLEDALDLHTFAPRDVASVVEEYLTACAEAGMTEVRVIHGKGIGVQRRIVESVLAKLPFVVEHRPADEWRGGWGATIVKLRAPTE